MTVPVAAFTVSATSGMMPFAAQFTDASTNTPTSWLWDFGDGLYSTEQNPLHTFNSPGSYYVKLTVTNASGSGSYTLPQPIGISLPDVNLSIQIGGTEERGDYCIGTLKITERNQARSTASFTLYNQGTFTPSYGQEIGIWDASRVDDYRYHPCITSGSGDYCISASSLTSGVKGTVRVAFRVNTLNVRQGLCNCATNPQIYVDTDNKIYVQFWNSNLPNSGLISTGITVAANTVYHLIVRWNSTTGVYVIRVNGVVTNSGIGGAWYASTGKWGIAQSGNTAASTNPLRGQLVDFLACSDYLTDADIIKLEAWVPFPYNDSRYIVDWDFKATLFKTTYQISTDGTQNLTLSGVTNNVLYVTMARKLFGGRILGVKTSSKHASTSPIVNLWYDVRCNDFGELLDRRIGTLPYSDGVTGGTEVLGWIEYLQAQLANEGLTFLHIPSSMPSIFPSTTVKYKTYNDLFKDLCKIVGYSFYIDYYFDLCVSAMSAATCPISLTDGSNNYRNFSVDREGSAYANAQYESTGDMSGSTETYTSSTCTFDKISSTLQYGEYTSEVTARQAIEGGTGLHEVLVTDNTTTTYNKADQDIESNLTTMGRVSEVISFETDCSSVQAGQVMSAVLSAFGVNGLYLLTSVSISDVGGMLLRKTVQGQKGKFLAQWTDYFNGLRKGA